MDMEHERRLTEVEERSKSNTHRIDELSERQNDLDKLVSTVAVLAEREKNIESDVQEIKVNVKSLTDKPGKKWENLTSQIISILAAAVVGYILARIGL